MSVRELIDQLKHLPREEQAAFAALFHEWEQSGSAVTAASLPGPTAQERQLVWPDFAGRMKRLFPNGPPPGQPLSEIIAEGRGNR